MIIVLKSGVSDADVEAVCRRVNLGYMDWKKIKKADYEGREAEGVLCVPKAGEILYRWRGAPPELGGAA